MGLWSHVERFFHVRLAKIEAVSVVINTKFISEPFICTSPLSAYISFSVSLLIFEVDLPTLAVALAHQKRQGRFCTIFA